MTYSVQKEDGREGIEKFGMDGLSNSYSMGKSVGRTVKSHDEVSYRSAFVKVGGGGG